MSTSSSTSLNSSSSMSMSRKDIILESYLVKTGPLNKALPLSWRQRWFVFSKTVELLDLSYYTDESKMKKKGSVDLTKFVSIKPSVTVGGRDNLFALEIQGRTYIMQAANSSSKNVWLAKLYEALSGERVFHAAIPQQTQLQADESLLRAVSKNELVIVNPTTGQTLCTIDYTTVRRHGSCNQILWFEICPCSASELKLYYWTITAGSSSCAQLARDIKLFIEQRNQKHMVAENLPEGQIFTSQCHFTCPVPVTAQTSGLPNQIRVMCKVKRRPTDLQRKGSEVSNATLNLLSSPPPQSPHALGPNSRQDSVDSVFTNSPDSSNTLATFRERQFSFTAADSPHSASFEHSRSLAKFRQNSTESSAAGTISPIIEEKVLVKMGSNLSLSARSESPYPAVARDSGVGSDGDLSPGNPRKPLEHMNSISSVGSASSHHSGNSANSGESDERPADEASRHPPTAPPRSEISLRMYATQRVAQPTN